MIALLQRVSTAEVLVDGERVGGIGEGLLAFVGVRRGDGERDAERLVERVLGYRVFPDGAGRMNLSLADTRGGLLAVPQFTLSADTRKGMRPGFSTGAHPDTARKLFEHFLAFAAARHPVVEAGRFGERMQVRLCNEGPVTFWLETRGSGAGTDAGTPD